MTHEEFNQEMLALSQRCPPDLKLFAVAMDDDKLSRTTSGFNFVELLGVLQMCSTDLTMQMN